MATTAGATSMASPRTTPRTPTRRPAISLMASRSTAAVQHTTLRNGWPLSTPPAAPCSLVRECPLLSKAAPFSFAPLLVSHPAPSVATTENCGDNHATWSPPLPSELETCGFNLYRISTDIAPQFYSTMYNLQFQVRSAACGLEVFLNVGRLCTAVGRACDAHSPHPFIFPLLFRLHFRHARSLSRTPRNPCHAPAAGLTPTVRPGTCCVSVLLPVCPLILKAISYPLCVQCSRLPTGLALPNPAPTFPRGPSPLRLLFSALT